MGDVGVGWHIKEQRHLRCVTQKNRMGSPSVDSRSLKRTGQSRRHVSDLDAGQPLRLLLPGRLVVPVAKPRLSKSHDEFSTANRERTGLERPITIDRVNVVVIALESEPTFAKRLRELVQFFIAVIAHQVGPPGTPPWPYGLVDQHGHAPMLSHADPSPPDAPVHTSDPAPSEWGWETPVMTRAGRRDAITLRLPASRAFADLPRVGLAALLRIHRIDPGDIGDLAASLTETAREMADGDSDVVVEFRVTDSEVTVDLTGDGRTIRISSRRT